MSASRPIAVALVGVYFSSIEAGLRQEGVEPLRIPVPYAGVGGWRRQLGRVAIFARAALMVLRTRPDVVHCVTGSEPNLIGNILPLVAARVARRPSILSIAGGEFHAVVRYRAAALGDLAAGLRETLAGRSLDRRPTSARASGTSGSSSPPTGASPPEVTSFHFRYDKIWLDIRVVYMTIINTILGEKNAC